MENDVTNRITPRRAPPRGLALISVFMILALLASIAVALLQVGVSNAAITDHTRDNQQALMMALAGLNQAFNELNLNKSITGTQAAGNPSANWGTQQSYSATTVTNADGTMTITSIGKFSGSASVGNITSVQRKLKAVVSGATTGGKFPAGGFGKQSIILSGSASTDSYNSGAGTTYSQQVAAAGGPAAYQSSVGQGGSVASNGPISGSGGMVVHGNATPGPSQKVSLSGSSAVTGSTAPASAPVSVPSYVYAPSISTLGAFNFNGTTVRTVGDYRYSSWTQSGGSITFPSGTSNIYVDGNFTQSGSAVMVLAAGAIVNIYQGSAGSFTLSGGGIVNQDQVPSHFSVSSASTSKVDISGQSDIYTTVYAPDAAVVVSGQAGFYGAVVGNSLTLSGSGAFHFDKAATSPALQGNVTLLCAWEEDI